MNKPTNEQTNEQEQPGALVEHFFRHEYANLVAVLVRAFGVNRFDLVEDQVQAAMLEAIHAWKQSEIPSKPAAWIHRVAKNRILDTLRREAVHQRSMALAGLTEDVTSSLVDTWLEAEELPDSLLRMMFVCCHPSLDTPSQIALALKTLCGFSNAEIASGLLSRTETIKKRVQRAKAKLAEQHLQVELPEVAELKERREAVHRVLYLMFNEGYSASHGANAVRDDICEEATRLCLLLCETDVANSASYALLALMLFHAARFEARIDDQGHSVRLDDQDRSKWNLDFVAIGERWLMKAGKELTRYHLEAGIAWHHCRAPTMEATDWGAIINIYDRLLERLPSPIYQLNRAIARAQSGDISQASEELDALAAAQSLKDYQLLDCARAKFCELAGKPDEAIKHYRVALQRNLADHERSFIRRRIELLSDENPCGKTKESC